MNLYKPNHNLIVGATRMGKSRLITYKIIRSFLNNQPLCYFDPKGSTYDLVRAFFLTEPGKDVWEKYKDRILMVNPAAKGGHILGFNALAPLSEFRHADPDYIALLSSSIVSHIRRQSGFEMNEANRMQNIMAAAIGLLVDGGKGTLSLAEMPLVFLQKPEWKDDGLNPFARRLLANASHFGTRSFWEHQWPNWGTQARREWVQSTEGRIFQYLFNEKLLYSTCAVKTCALDFEQIVNEGYWLLVNLPAQMMDETMTMMLGNLIITKIFYACMQRGTGGRPYHLILDEARFFNSGPLQLIMDTAGEYGLWLTVMAQNLNQMCESSDGRLDIRLRESILNNCGQFMIFQSRIDAPTFAELMCPITGQVAIGVNSRGEYDYLSAQAEQSRNEEQFRTLANRHLIYYDGDTNKPTLYLTPDVDVPAVESRTLDFLETEQMAATGFSKLLIHQEIVERQREIYAEIDPSGDLWKKEAPIKRITPGLYEGYKRME